MSLVVIKVAVAFGEGTVVRLRGTGLGAHLDRMCVLENNTKTLITK